MAKIVIYQKHLYLVLVFTDQVPGYHNNGKNPGCVPEHQCSWLLIWTVQVSKTCMLWTP